MGGRSPESSIKHWFIWILIDTVGHRRTRSRMKLLRSVGRILHWLPSCAAASSSAVIQRRTVLLETWQRAATSSMVSSCPGAGSFAMARQSLCLGALLDGAASSTGRANVSPAAAWASRWTSLINAPAASLWSPLHLECSAAFTFLDSRSDMRE